MNKCNVCEGRGKKLYPSIAGWRAPEHKSPVDPSMDYCDTCWGSGRSDVTGPNLREMSVTHREVCKALYKKGRKDAIRGLNKALQESYDRKDDENQKNDIINKFLNGEIENEVISWKELKKESQKPS